MTAGMSQRPLTPRNRGVSAGLQHLTVAAVRYTLCEGMNIEADMCWQYA